MENGTDIIWLEMTESTNKTVRSHINELDNMSVVSAISQSEGHGQHGREWVSEAGRNLTFSILLKNPPLKADEQFSISEMTALAITSLLAENDIEATIKWPNDIYVGDRKICGILIENSLAGKTIEWSIIGIGLNVNQTIFPERLPNPTSMMLQNASAGKEDYDLKTLLEDFIRIFTEYHEKYLCSPEDRAALNKLYCAKMWKI